MHPTIKKLLSDIENENSGFDCGIEDLEWEYNDHSINFTAHLGDGNDVLKPFLRGIAVVIIGVFSNVFANILPGVITVPFQAICMLAMVYYFGRSAFLFVKAMFFNNGEELAGDIHLHVIVNGDYLKCDYVEGKKVWSKIINHAKSIHSQNSKAA